MLENLGKPIKQRKPDGSVIAWNDRSLKIRADLPRIVWPDECDLQQRVGYVREYVEAARDTGIGVLHLCGCIWQTLYEFVIGWNDCMVLLLEDLELFDELMSRLADYFAELVRSVIAAGVDILFLADDFAYNKGLFVRQQVMERLWQPHFDRIIEAARCQRAMKTSHPEKEEGWQ